MQAYERQVLQRGGKKDWLYPKAPQVGGRGLPRWRSAGMRPSQS